MKREEAHNLLDDKYTDMAGENHYIEEFIDEIFDQHEAELNELKNRSCESCKYSRVNCLIKERAFELPINKDTFNCAEYKAKQ